MVDFAAAEHGWCEDGAAPDGVHPSVLVCFKRLAYEAIKQGRAEAA